MRLSAIFLLTLAVFIVSPARADYTIQVTGGSVAVTINGSLAQGVPSRITNETSNFGYVPVFQHTLLGDNASFLTTLLNTAIRTKTPSASAALTLFSARSNGTMMNYNLSFQVSNIVRESNGIQTVNLSWRSFSLADDFGAGGVSINRIVPNYLETSIIAEALIPTSSAGVATQAKAWYLNSQSVQAKIVPSIASNLVLFDFSPLSVPLQNWGIIHNPPSKFVLQSSTGFNLTEILRITEAGETTLFNTNVTNKLQVTIETPFPTQITSNEVSFDTGGGFWPQLMLAIALVLPAILIVTYLGEKRIQPSFRSARRPGKKR